MLNSDDFRMLYTRKKIYIPNITFSQKLFIKSYTNNNNNLVLRQKSTNNLYVENGILQKLRDCFLNITRMINILHKKLKYNIATYNLNEYKSYTKQPQLIYS